MKRGRLYLNEANDEEILTSFFETFGLEYNENYSNLIKKKISEELEKRNYLIEAQEFEPSSEEEENQLEQ